MKTIKIRRFYQANPSKTIRINLDNIGMLRQYINESNESITNAMILYWLTGENKYIEEHYEEKAHNDKIMREIADNTWGNLKIKINK